MTDCKHPRVMKVSAKASDMQSHAIPHLNIDCDGQNPSIQNLCGGDYLRFTVCLDCGTIIGFVSPTDDELIEMFQE